MIPNVRYDEQTLTEAQKGQARSNIGAIEDALSDNKQYARKNGAWAEVKGTGDIIWTKYDYDAEVEGGINIVFENLGGVTHIVLVWSGMKCETENNSGPNLRINNKLGTGYGNAIPLAKSSDANGYDGYCELIYNGAFWKVSGFAAGHSVIANKQAVQDIKWINDDAFTTGPATNIAFYDHPTYKTASGTFSIYLGKKS